MRHLRNSIFDSGSYKYTYQSSINNNFYLPTSNWCNYLNAAGACSVTMNKMLTVTMILTAFSVCESARILGIISTPSYSHQVVFQPLWKELSLRGHQVTVLTTDPINDPKLTNLTEIDLSFSYKVLDDKLLDIINSSKNILKVLDLTLKTFSDVTDHQLQFPPVRNLIDDRTQEFDLVIAEYLMPVMFFFAKRFQCPYIGILSTDPPNTIYGLIGNPTHPVLYPNFMMATGDKPTLFERITLVVYDIIMELASIRSSAMQQDIVLKHFGYNTPVDDFMSNASLLFVNADPVFHLIRPLVPAVVQIGGPVERVPVKPLEKELKIILDEAVDGFIYFSLGSNVKSKDIPLETLSTILKTFKELPYKILWKYELTDLPNKPNNVILSKWLPQPQVLAHPNLKLFITHGGAQSKEEAIFAKVPIVGMPFFVDQRFNIQNMVSLRFALSVDYRYLEIQSFKQAILEVINNPKYRNRVKELAELAEDQPMTGLEKAVWWTEYVIRHKGAAHLRSPALDIPWYQYYLFDVIATIVGVFSIASYLLVVSIKCLLNFFKSIITKPLKVKKQ